VYGRSGTCARTGPSAAGGRRGSICRRAADRVSYGAFAVISFIIYTDRFVGLAAPHAARALVGNLVQPGTPLSVLLGTLLALVADSVGRSVIAPVQLPAGLLTALIGTVLPLFDSHDTLLKTPRIAPTVTASSLDQGTRTSDYYSSASRILTRKRY